MYTKTTINNLLINCVKRPITQQTLFDIKVLYKKIPDKRKLRDIAISNKVQSVVAEALDMAIGFENNLDWWKKGRQETYNRISNQLAEIDRVGRTLVSRNINTILLENGGLARIVYPNPSLYEFGDFDLMAKSEDINKIHNLLSGLGYRIANKSSTSHKIDMSNGRIEYILSDQNANGLRLNVQTRLVARRWFRAVREPNFDTLFNRSIPIDDSGLRILGKEDFLFQLCIHNAAHGFIRKPGLRLHLDIDWYVRNSSVNWEDFISIVNRFRTKTLTYFALFIPKLIFSTPIPIEVINSFKPPEWKDKLISSWLKKSGVLDSNKPKFSKIKYFIFTVVLYDRLIQFLKEISLIDFLSAKDLPLRHREIRNLFKVPFSDSKFN